MRFLLLATSAIVSVAPVQALAQAAPRESVAPADQSATSGAAETAAAAQAVPASQGLNDIVVTAQRRAENLQRAAVPVAAVSGADLVTQGITQASRLNELVPALTVQPTSTGNLLFIRGVGNFTVSPNADPASAFNYDGVYIGRPTGSTGVFFDLQRVEVLKGPQGTLYGRNATGGAINVIPAQPEIGQFSGYGTVSYGNYNQVVAEGALNLPMGDRGAARISFSRASHDGYLNDGTSDQDQWSGRVQLKAELTPNLTARVSGDYSRSLGIGQSISYVGNYVYSPTAGRYLFVPSNLGLQEGVFTPAAQAYRTTISAGAAGRRFDALAPYPFVDNSFYGSNAQIDWKTGIGTVTIVPAYRYSNLDYLSSAGAFPYRQREKDQQDSVEVRLQGNRIGAFDYTLGGFYYHESIDVKTALSTGATATFTAPRYRTESFAPFGRLTLHLTDALRLVGGVRYTQDHKTFTGPTTALTVACGVRVAGVPTCPTAPLFPLVDDPSQLAFAVPAIGGAPAPILVNGVPTGAVDVRVDRADNSALTNRKVTYRGAVEFDVAPQSLLYASVETGYRSGGFSAAAGFETYDPETITAYTIGSKNRFFDNRVQLNVEGFWWEYRGQQVSSVRLDNAGRTANITQNIGSSRIKGVEVDGRVLVTPTTLIGADVQYLDARNLSFTYLAQNSGVPPLTGCPATLNAAINQYQINCAGFASFNSPKWTLNVSGQQTFHLTDFNLVVGADTQYKTGLYGGFGYTAEEFIHPGWLTNAQVSFGPASERWSISGYVRNIEGHRTPAYQSLAPVSNALIAGTIAPRTYGARVAFKF